MAHDQGKIMSKYLASDSSQSPAWTKPAARAVLLCAVILAFGATALFAQVVGVEVRQPVGIPTPSNVTTGPDADKDLVAKRWETMPDAPKQDAKADKAKHPEAAKP